VIPRALATGSGDAVVVDFIPDATPLVDGDLIQIQHIAANTGAMTINADSGGAIATYKGAGLPLAAGDIPGANFWGLYVFDASANALQMVNPATGVTAVSGTLLTVTAYTCPAQALTSISQASPGVMTSSNAALRPVNGSPVRFTTTGVLPAPLALLTDYWVVGSTPGGSTWNVSATKGGAAINTTTAGSGTHSVGNAPYVKATNGPAVVEVEVQGGGGGSGGCSGTGYTTGGGGSGGYASLRILASALAASETVTTGAGGTAGPQSATPAGNGGTSSFGAFVQATGGTGSSGIITTAATAGQPGGIGSGGDVNLQGNGGACASFISGGSTGAINAGIGGASPRFGGASPAPGSPGADQAGAPGGNGTGAGATGVNGNGGTPRFGAAGGSGIVVIREYK
jgi:hypothetical protein